MMERLVNTRDGRCRSVFFVNANTLNVTAEEPDYRQVLNSADIVFNDGTGVRWAARQRGIVVRDNLNGTDLVPAFFASTRNRGYRFFLFGIGVETIKTAAEVARRQFTGWELAGYHHGYIHDGDSQAVIEEINDANAELLLVGMGNPLQERWIHCHQAELKVPLAMGVGGLFDYWGGNLGSRALGPSGGCEWVHLLLRQPHKWRRYLLGNPKFVYRMWPRRVDLLNMISWKHRDTSRIAT